MTLTFTTAIQYFHLTPQLMTIYHQTMLSCKRMINSEDIVKTVPLKNYKFWRYNRNGHILTIWTLIMTLQLKILSQKFSTTHPADDDAPTHSSLVTKGWSVQKISSGQNETDGETASAIPPPQLCYGVYKTPFNQRQSFNNRNSVFLKFQSSGSEPLFDVP